ncbi:hypothetical protein [Pseudomonas proteolytica]|uniref:MafI family immunity protein n=1 Tax=Pseudomonas proteolytica TaxID=219574 RepID=A0AAW4ZY00_9PSED|nr:hypothetical protein [Pseudomonas proteolytica]KAA8701972.1 hypothetical protein F4W61_13170 [Pseudomonas proteolytica]MCF5055401.1 hypothetical protein [Pseudomonas proteolytica]MCF5099256.1 hypothetical protein [Pseudomonas proteolytica]NMZ05938.1 hypothetical protein [Pseudomonas proteolytica]NMZ12256.1 hypothetical protein [Pseudomonas proteolytica]
MNNLIEALNAGKRRGYEERCEIDGASFLFQYAIKKQNNLYYTYFFSVEESQMDVIEDDENEEIQTFRSLDEALSYLINRGAIVEKFSAIKNTLPF